MVRDNPTSRNRLVRIEKPAQTTTSGKTVETWALYSRVWVRIEPLSGREYWDAKEQTSAITHKMTGAWGEFENVKADFRVVYEGRTFHLAESPRNIEEANVLAEMLIVEETR